MQREEGREVRFSIVRMAAAKPQAGRIFTLKEPLVYSDRTLRKISGAIDPITSAFLVDPQGDGAEPIIWGFGYFGNNFLKNLPVATGYESPWPEDLVISAINPGIVSLARGSTSLGVIEFGAYTGPIPTPMTSMAMGNRLIALIANDAGYRKHKNYYWQVYNHLLEQLLLTVNRLSHGATLVLVPTPYVGELAGKYHDGLVPNGSFQIAELITKRLEVPETRGPGLDGLVLSAALAERLAERVAGLAKLACVDGALLLTTELEVIAFGAKLDVKAPAPPVIVGPDGFKPNGHAFDLNRYGTRHNSAARIVGACEHVIAFVSSTDGPIRGFAKDDLNNCLICWPDFRASMFARDIF